MSAYDDRIMAGYPENSLPIAKPTRCGVPSSAIRYTPTVAKFQLDKTPAAQAEATRRRGMIVVNDGG